MQESIEGVTLTRLKWACRRGMLELDVLLNNFLQEAYAGLSPLHQRDFEKLLNIQDPELFDLLMGKSLPLYPDLAEITEMIRHHALSKL